MIAYDLLHVGLSQHPAILLLYAGPDQILPLVSILGTIIGFLLIMGRRVIGLVKKAWRLFSKKPEPPPAKIGRSPKLDHAVTGERAIKE